MRGAHRARPKNSPRHSTMMCARFDERYAERFKKVGSDVVELRQRSAITGGFVLALRENGARKSPTGQRRGIGDGGRLYAGRSLGALDGGAEELLAAPLVVMQGAEIEIEHKQFGGFEAGINALRVLHAANEEARAD